jgi:hypothetical protein
MCSPRLPDVERAIVLRDNCRRTFAEVQRRGRSFSAEVLYTENQVFIEYLAIPITLSRRPDEIESGLRSYRFGCKATAVSARSLQLSLVLHTGSTE